jgi:4-hydroxyacetophenone monooxygenase
MRDFGIAEHVRLETEVVSARWQESTGRWAVRLRRADGSAEDIEADAVVSAVGQLNRPKLPDIPGRETFSGVSMHSAEWIGGTKVAGKRVAVIGTGASAFQIVPTIAGQVARLSVFQRSAPWMFPNPHYHDQVGPGALWAFEHLPYYGRWYRFLLFWPACDGGLPAMRIDPEWPDQGRSISATNDAAREVFTQWMAEQIGDDPELLAKVVPDYVCLGKRTLQDNGSWLAALVRDNVELVSDPIAEIVPDGIRGRDGRVHPVDVIIYATGFHANRFLWPMEIVGRGGAVLAEQWGDEPTAYLGMTVPNFPNFFCLYGPGTNLAHGGSIIFHTECQVRYIMGCIGALVADGGSLACRQDVHDEYNRRLQAELDTMVWSHPSIRHSWYRNDAGRIHILSPWRLVDYWRWTRAPDLTDFELTPAGAAGSEAAVSA